MRCDLLADGRRSRLLRHGAALAAAAVAVAAIPVAVRMVLPPAPAPALSAGVGVAAAQPGPEASRPAVPEPPASAATATGLKTRPLSAWLADVARDAGRDLVMSPELRGDLTASESASLDWRTRLESYARVFGFEFAVGDGLIEARRAEVSRPAPPAREEEAGPGGSASGPAVPPEAIEEAPPETRVVRLAHASAKDAAAVMARAVEALDVTAAPDPSTNSVVLCGPAAALGRALRVLGELDRPLRRVLLEVKIVEVTRSARLDLGVEWKLAGDVGAEAVFPPDLSDAGSAALLVATGGSPALDARISALEADGRLRVVSRPRVVMREGSPATIESVRILRIRLPSRGSVVGDEVVEAPSSDRATEDIPVGVRLEVTPAIRGGSRVLMRIRAKSSSLGAPLPPDDIPEELSRMVDAEVLVASGETAVLGGLSRDAGTRSGAGVPGLRRIPGLGVLFGRRSKDREREELVVFVTPRVLD